VSLNERALALQQVADLVTDAMAKAGLSKELQDRIALELKPIIDLRGKMWSR
jgi:hypothetical protein